MAGYGDYRIEPVDVTKSLMLGETVRQNRMMEELKSYQINKARREDQVATQVGTYLDAALKGDPKAEAALAGLSPEWRLKVAQLKSDQEMRAVLLRLREAQTLRTERLAAGGTGTGGILPPPAAMGGPVAPSPMSTPLGPRPGGGPVAPMGGAPRPAPFGYSLPGQQSALPGADTTGADVPSPVPVEPAAPALPPGRFQGIGAVPTLDPAIPVPEGESGNEPPVVPVQVPGTGPSTPGRAPVPGGPAWVREALVAGYAPVRDAKNKAVIEGDMMEMWTPDRKDRVFVPMKPPEKWSTDPADPQYQRSVSGKRELIPQRSVEGVWETDPTDKRIQVNSKTNERRLGPGVDRFMIDPNDKNIQIDLITNERKPIKDSDKLTEAQAKDYSYSLRMARTLPEFEKLAYKGQRPTAVERFANSPPTVFGIPLVPGTRELHSELDPAGAERTQSFQQMERDLVSAILRRESGAQISESEWKNAREQYIPQPGDTPGVTRNKLQNLRTAFEGMSISSGRPEDFGVSRKPSLKRPDVPGPPAKDDLRKKYGLE